MAKTLKKQKMRYDETELSLIKSLFAENEEALILLRKIFLQAELSENEIKLIKAMSKEDSVKNIIRKAYLPGIEMEAPFGQVVDMWLTIDGKEKSPEELVLDMKVRTRLNEMLEAGLTRLAEPKSKGLVNVIDYKPDYTKDDTYNHVELMARNSLISHTEAQLNQMDILAGFKEESVEDTKKRLMQDSAK